MCLWFIIIDIPILINGQWGIHPSDYEMSKGMKIEMKRELKIM